MLDLNQQASQFTDNYKVIYIVHCHRSSNALYMSVYVENKNVIKSCLEVADSWMSHTVCQRIPHQWVLTIHIDVILPLFTTMSATQVQLPLLQLVLTVVHSNSK